MDYLASFRISASGMQVEKLRADLTAINLANMNSTRSANGVLFKPLRVVSGASGVPGEFAATFESMSGQAPLAGTELLGVEEIDAAPRMVYDPSHPDANDKGFVAYPGINHLGEMMNLMTAMRTYEANVVAMNAAKTMALKALDIGGGS